MQIVILDIEKCALRTETVCVSTIPNLIRKLCVQNRFILYGLLFRSASDPYSGRRSARGGGGSVLQVRPLLKGGGLSDYFPIQGKSNEDV